MQLILANSDKVVKLCRRGMEFLHHKQLTEGWRLHSAGYAVLQYSEQGKIHTLYLHKILAEEFVHKPLCLQKLFVHYLNQDKLDCRVENLTWRTMGELRRFQSHSKMYRGVSQDGKKFRSVLYDGGKRIYLGMFETPEDAARAYDTESLKRFGITSSLNFKD